MTKTKRGTSRVQGRLIDELMGISRGVIADGIVDEQEAIFIGQWIEQHREVSDKWPVNILYTHFVEMLKDGVLSKDEQKELMATLRDITGESSVFQEPNRSTTLPLDIPAPVIDFEDKTFCLTGRFVFGTLRDCEETIADMSGSVVQSPS